MDSTVFHCHAVCAEAPLNSPVTEKFVNSDRIEKGALRAVAEFSAQKPLFFNHRTTLAEFFRVTPTSCLGVAIASIARDQNRPFYASTSSSAISGKNTRENAHFT